MSEKLGFKSAQVGSTLSCKTTCVAEFIQSYLRGVFSRHLELRSTSRSLQRSSGTKVNMYADLYVLYMLASCVRGCGHSVFSNQHLFVIQLAEYGSISKHALPARVYTYIQGPKLTRNGCTYLYGLVLTCCYTTQGPRLSLWPCEGGMNYSITRTFSLSLSLSIYIYIYIY